MGDILIAGCRYKNTLHKGLYTTAHFWSIEHKMYIDTICMLDSG